MAQLLSFSLLWAQRRIAIQSERLLLGGGRSCGRYSKAQAPLAPFQFQVGPSMSRRLIAVSAEFARLHLAFLRDEVGEAVGPGIELFDHFRLADHVFSLI